MILDFFGLFSYYKNTFCIGWRGQNKKAALFYLNIFEKEAVLWVEELEWE